MKTLLAFASIVLLAACGGGGDVVAPPPPVKTGSLSFELVNCAGFQNAEYVVDSVTVGTEALVQGGVSKSYTVPAGTRSTRARLTSPGSTVGTWTYNDRVVVPENGSVTAHPHC